MSSFLLKEKIYNELKYHSFNTQDLMKNTDRMTKREQEIIKNGEKIMNLHLAYSVYITFHFKTIH